MNNHFCVGIFILTLLFFGIIFYNIITRKYIYYENMVSASASSYTTCGQMNDCNTCVSNTTPNGICYWCKNKGCVNPDDYYDPNSCSRDQAKCTALAAAPATALANAPVTTALAATGPLTTSQ